MVRKHQMKLLLKSNLFKTIWFNLKVLPLKQAIRLPIYLFGKINFRSLDGCIKILSPIYSGMITIGREGFYVANTKPSCQWMVKGTIIFNGPVRFGGGSYVTVAKNATLNIGTKGTYIGSNSVIICFDSITIGDKVDLAWECQVIDTSFHYIESTDNSFDVKPLTQPVIIGDRVWIGNRTTISKGSVIPDDNIVASNSLVNKDFSLIGSFNMLAGIPAKVIKKGINRIRGPKEKELDIQFGYDRTHL